MADIIQLLPDAIANQIAAGEVIQRPASVVKELMENAVDAAASKIQLHIKEAGRLLIQVIDNGCGMSETDARMSFEKHATSKIKSADELFRIMTKGFRGEALASVAAIAQVELKTRLHELEQGTHIKIEGSKVQSQVPCQTPVGTIISVRNLFYNVPARRNFLKSHAAEFRHILEEFQRVALSHPDIHFVLTHDEKEIMHLPKSNLRQRLINVFGKNTNQKLVPIAEETEDVKVSGFVGKPEFAKKTRGEQYFFVNDRFIKSPYLNHAVMAAYEELIPKGAFPLYCIYLRIEPSRIDVNVHPTKQEIKFEDDRMIYNFVKVAARHALGKHHLTPMLDFDRPRSLDILGRFEKIGNQHNTQQQNKSDFTSAKSSSGPVEKPSGSSADWRQLYTDIASTKLEQDDNLLTLQSKVRGNDAQTDTLPLDVSQKAPYQLHKSYIISQIKPGFLLIDQQAASERILFEKYLAQLKKQEQLPQKSLFPKTVELTPTDGLIFHQIYEQLNMLGFDIQDFGNHTFIIHGVPAELSELGKEQEIIDELLAQCRQNTDIEIRAHELIAKSLAKSVSIKKGRVLEAEEMQTLIDQLFGCELPYKSPGGRSCFITFNLEDLNHQFSS